MENKKSLTIGITINLDNYENLRLELEGEIVDDHDAALLVSDLDRILSGLGRGDEVTAERIDSYRRRVLSRTVDLEEMIAGTKEYTPDVEIPQKNEKEISSVKTAGKKLHDEEIKVKSNSGTLFSYKERDTVKALPIKEQPDEGKKDQALGEKKEKTGLACESCGAPITEKQRKISQMFTDKNLCEKCIQTEQGMKQ